mmetsp:Transcript_15495/g.17743  ORF Transcript_15495/g.17743 Transcript_15495/m.17743 type:complete len:949 (+) Transcript_15495:23-2869(+)
MRVSRERQQIKIVEANDDLKTSQTFSYDAKSALIPPVYSEDATKERQYLMKHGHKLPQNDSTRISFSFIVLLITGLLLVITNGIPFCIHITSESLDIITETGIAQCKELPCFIPSKIYVPISSPGFPSFLNYANRGPIHVSYDKRSLKINDNRVLFLGGSMHPARTTRQTWNFALDEAVHNGLNLITIYVMWSDHQPVRNKEINWTFPDWSSPHNAPCHDTVGDLSCEEWNLAAAITSAADRGLFVHLRVGPYDCAEYTYGGIPEWLLLEKPNMRLRRPNFEWLETMESFVVQIIDYVSDNKLYAHQGGPIILSQIENELGEGDDQNEVTDAHHEGSLYVDSRGQFVDLSENTTYFGPIRKATLQDYADWCGEIAKKFAPEVQWTMCNGLSANNTIQTCNAINNGAEWLESHGGNNRIQVDQPALLTEFEEGFQDWGETPGNPNDYFWGRNARAATKEALRWFARGGTHLNYYMFFGGYNRGRQAAGGIGNWYATDAALCSSGQRHQPKFSHYQSLHQVIAGIASILLTAETALGNEKLVEVMNNDKKWVIGKKQRRFEYFVNSLVRPKSFNQVIFVENDASEEVVIRIPIINGKAQKYQQFSLAPSSAILVVDGVLEFDSATINPNSMSFKREFMASSSIPALLGWSSWPERIGAEIGDPMTLVDKTPFEQTRLNVESSVWSDYAWYETSLTIERNNLNDATLFIESQRSNGLLVFVDDSFVGSAEDHSHIFEGNLTIAVKIGHLSIGQHKLSILSESMGYSNLIGRFGNSQTGPKLKGISGEVLLSGSEKTKNISLVDGREWRSFPGLHGEREVDEENLKPITSKYPSERNPIWTSFLFSSPMFDPTFQSLFLQITTGRGHLWINDKDLGRFWNITEGRTDKYSQQYYFLPIDYLRTDGSMNEVVLFSSMGGGSLIQNNTKLVLSWISPSSEPNFNDEVAYPLACI